VSFVYFQNDLRSGALWRLLSMVSQPFEMPGGAAMNIQTIPDHNQFPPHMVMQFGRKIDAAKCSQIVPQQPEEHDGTLHLRRKCDRRNSTQPVVTIPRVLDESLPSRHRRLRHFQQTSDFSHTLPIQEHLPGNHPFQGIYLWRAGRDVDCSRSECHGDCSRGCKDAGREG
jgi:hypothetical protein